MREPLIVIVDGDGQVALGVFLTDDVAIQVFGDFAGERNLVEQGAESAGLAFFLLDDVVAEIDAVGADVGVARSFDHGADFAMRLAAEAAHALLAFPIRTGAAAGSAASAAGSPAAVISAAVASACQGRILPR